VRFERVDFSYEPRRQILFEVSSRCRGEQGRRPSGTAAPENPLWRGSCSGSTTSTRAAITINGATSARDGNRPCALPSASSLRTRAFNDTILYNIHYGRPGASPEEVVEAAKAAAHHEFIESLPDPVRVARTASGAEALRGPRSQRVAIARAI